MDRLFHRHALRHLDTDLIDRIDANGPQGRKPAPAHKTTSKMPRDKETYRQNGANRPDRWRASARSFRGGPFAGSIHLNRSPRWQPYKHITSYALARELSPSLERVR